MKKLLFALTFLLASCAETAEPILSDVHYHADFKVYLRGTAYDFAQEKYMSTDENKLSNFTHLHNMDGGVIHKHMSTVTLGDFFTSLSMELTNDCFTLDTGESYCDDEENKLTMWVNGEPNSDFENYLIQDLDRILVSYGHSTSTELEAQMASVGDNACIYSETCPERGPAPDESSCLSSEDCTAEPEHE